MPRLQPCRAVSGSGEGEILPSEYSRRLHAKLIGLDGPVIPDPIPLDRIVAEKPEPTYATFINPQPPNGMTVFARIALDKFWGDPEFESRHRALAAPRPGDGSPAASPTSSSGCSDRWAEGLPHAKDEPMLISRTPVATQWADGRDFITHSGR